MHHISYIRLGDSKKEKEKLPLVFLPLIFFKDNHLFVHFFEDKTATTSKGKQPSENQSCLLMLA